MTSPNPRELRWLRAHAVINTPVLALLALAAFRQDAPKARFSELDVERINVVEPDGKLRMVISNRPRSTGPIYKGQPFGYPGGGRPGSSSSTTKEARTVGSRFPAVAARTDGSPRTITSPSISSIRTRWSCSTISITTGAGRWGCRLPTARTSTSSTGWPSAVRSCGSPAVGSSEPLRSQRTPAPPSDRRFARERPPGVSG